MSFNQSSYQKNDHRPPPEDPLNPGRSPGFSPHRPFSKGGPPSASRSFKKPGNAYQQSQSQSQTQPQLQSRVRTRPAPSPSVVHTPSPHQPPEVPLSMTQPSDASSAPYRCSRPAPKPPTSRLPAASSHMGSPAMPMKGDASKISVQFGSITPGFVNGMQVPARTSSAPPNLDEQRHDQVGHVTMKSNPPVPLPVAPEQHLAKNIGVVDSSMEKDHALSKVMKDQVLPSASATLSQKHVVHPMPLKPMPMSFPQSSVPLQFGGQNQQIQSQGPTATPMQFPIPLPIPISVANAPRGVQQQIFVPGLQPHALQPHAMMHQVQGLNFGPQLSSQLPPQMGNLGMGVSTYSSPQVPKFGGQRKSLVKITHPDTRQEVRLDERMDTFADGPLATRAHLNFPPQSQPIASYSANPSVNFYHSYGQGPLYSPATSSVPLASSQITPQAPRFHHNASEGPQTIQMENAQDTLVSNIKGWASVSGALESVCLDHAHDKTRSDSVVAQGTMKQETSLAGDNLMDISPKVSATVEIIEPSRVSRNYAGSPSDSCICPIDTLSEHKSVSEALSTASLHGKVEGVTPASTAVSISGDSPTIRIAVVDGGPAKSFSNAFTDSGGRRDDLMLSNLKEGKMTHGDNDLIKSEIKVREDLGSMSGNNVLTSPSRTANSQEDLKDIEAAAVTVLVSSTISNSSVASNGTDGTALATPANHEDSKADDTNITGELLSDMVAEAEQTDIHLSEMLEESADQSEICSVSLEYSGSVRETDGEVRSLQVFEKDKRAFESQTLKSDANEQYFCINHDKGVDSSLNSAISGSIPCTIVSSSSASDSPSYTDTFTTDGITTGSKVVMECAAGAKANLPEKTTNLCDKENSENKVGSSGVLHAAGLKENSALDTMKGRNLASKGKKKRKEILQKADAAGATSDLYLAYKGPEDNKEIVECQDKEMTSHDNDLKKMSAEACGEGSVVSEDSDLSKAEPDDWEDVADISTPKLESANARQLGETSATDVQTGSVAAKKYSRDFLLNFVDKCPTLPKNFVVTSDIAEAFIPSLNSSSVPIRDSHHAPGRVDRQSGGPRLDRRLSNLNEDERWNKQPAHFNAGQNMHIEVGFGMNMGFQPVHGGNHGVLRSPLVQTHVPYIGGLPGAMQSLGSQGGFVRNSPDSDRWQRAAGFQHKGLIPSPYAPLQAMHKAEKKYEVGKVTDEEAAKQRQLKAILNKLTPQNFEKLFEQVKAVNIDNAVTLKGLISQIFDKALMEPTFCEMYADLCRHLSQELPDLSDDNEKITFRRLLLNKCQEEFERGEREQEEADKVHDEGEAKLSEEGREEKRVKARRRMLGNIRFIGELYKKKMLTEKIMHECIKKLLGQHQTPHEEDIEALCKLMSTIGEMIDHPKARDHIDAYFERMEMLSNEMSLSSRVRFMLKDSIELRKRKWQQRRKVEGPKKIEEVHRDAAQERHAQVGRLGSRSPATNPSARRNMPMDFSPRVSNVLSSPASHIGGLRGSQVRGYGIGSQDVRFGESQSFQARPLTVPLPQRHMGDDSSITLGPQGGLGKGMSFRGQQSSVLSSTTDSSRIVDSQRSGGGLSGLSFGENIGHGSRTDTTMLTENFQGCPSYNQNRMPDPGNSSGVATSPSSQGLDSDLSCSKGPEERLRDKSIAAIREFYSAKDENEVALCVKDLEAVSFYPSMVSLWVTDSFERKAKERDILADLLVNLTRPRHSILNQVQLIKGFESALQCLEDAVNDSPKAPEYLGSIFGKAIAEDTVSLGEIGKIILEGGEEPGGLLEAGLAAVVLESALERIMSLKGETVLEETWRSSNLRGEDFRPSDRIRSQLLGRFIPWR
ncbi:hypothetical protein MLD38_020738 [Melastoma candidum]|uniref:Uncharacterized protein n=1 Tax=Melastoma candidum TaxID=119954 RepID=A0ACB9QE43_9MYRT|nr:hypothetical protein MLD38_020738 [Melastoma candidum]